MKTEDTLSSRRLTKAATGIRGFDELTGGGLPRGRTSLVCGGAGCGKTTFAMEFLVRGALEFDEPGVFLSFEESGTELTENFASMGFDLEALKEQGKLVVDHVSVQRNEIEETGEYDLEALFIRIGFAVDSVGAKRVVLDTIEALFSAFPGEGILRAELRRLFRWLKDRGLTAIVTGEKGEKTLTRYGLEEYVADCVIFLDHRIIDQISTRRLRIVKYRGAEHGTDEYPFLISRRGVSVMPLSSLGLEHEVSSERVSSGIERLDTMLGGGFYRGSTILLSGTAGTGKTSIACSFADATCRQGERCLYLAFEEPRSQILRNMKSIGIDLQTWIDRGLLQIRAERGTAYGLEMHLLYLHDLIDEFRPSAVIIDPLTAFMSQGSRSEVRGMAARLTDMLRARGITGLFVSLTSGSHQDIEESEVDISSLIDSWLFLRSVEHQGERNRVLNVLKSRGTSHSNQFREFVINRNGIDLLDVYVGPEGVLTGAARAAQESRERAEGDLRQEQIAALRREFERRERAFEAQTASLNAAYQAEIENLRLRIAQEELREATVKQGRVDMARRRQADAEG